MELKLSDLEVMKEVCESSYRECEDEAQEAAWMRNRLLAEIAGQLAKQNEHLSSLRESVAALAAR